MHCLAYLSFPSLWALNAATSNASDAPGTITSRWFWINSHEVWYAYKGSLENPSKVGVNSGRSLSSSSKSGGADVDVDVDGEGFGLRVSNSVVVVFNLGASSFAFLMG